MHSQTWLLRLVVLATQKAEAEGLNVQTQPSLEYHSFCQLDTNLDIPGENESRGTAPIRLSDGRVYGAVSSLLMDIGGPSLLWMVLFPRRWAWIVQEKHLNVRLRRSQEAALLHELCFSSRLQFSALSSCLGFP